VGASADATAAEGVKVTERVVLACEMIEDEVNAALAALPEHSRPPLVWVESGLHDVPDRLREALQALIDLLDEAGSLGRSVALPSLAPGKGPAEGRREEVVVPPPEEVLLAFGFCGKGLLDLSSRRMRLVFPRVDDCISLFLNRGCRREDIERDSHSFYLTRGWLSHDSQFAQYFEEWVERYGPEKAARLRRMMFAGYERIGLIDTGAYEIDACLDKSLRRAADIDLGHEVIPGSIQLLERMFGGEHDSEIVRVPPGERISYLHLLEAPADEEPRPENDRRPRTKE
jgi:hypothetical protein